MNDREYDFYKRAVTVFAPAEINSRQSEFVIEGRGHLVPGSKETVIYQPKGSSDDASYNNAPLNQRICFNCNPNGLAPQEKNILQALILFPFNLRINSDIEDEDKDWAMEGINPVILSNLFYPYKGIEWQAVYALCHLSSENFITSCLAKDQGKLITEPA